jgi:hypothetical protein
MPGERDSERNVSMMSIFGIRGFRSRTSGSICSTGHRTLLLETLHYNSLISCVHRDKNLPFGILPLQQVRFRA